MVLACCLESRPIIRMLIRHGANVNAQDYDGRTVLASATRLGTPAAILDVLTKAGARA